MQVQSKNSSGIVNKLSYIKRGPCKIVKDYQSGWIMWVIAYSWKIIPGHNKKAGLQLVVSSQQSTVLGTPLWPIRSSGFNFGNLHKKRVLEPYQIIRLYGYKPSQPWSESPDAIQLKLALLQNLPSFPTLQDLDDKFNQWPKSGNPFINRDMMTPGAVQEKFHNNYITIIPSSTRTKATIITDLIQLEVKVFFIAYSQGRSQRRCKEWKLVRINFRKSLQQHPSCRQVSRFQAEFFIEHHQDKNLDTSDWWYWLEYYSSNSHNTLSVVDY